MKVQELLANPENWTKGKYAKDKYNYTVNPDSPEACKWCILGAVEKCTTTTDEFYEVVDKIKEHIKGYESIANFNDAPTTTHEHVLTVLKKADV